MKYTKKDLGSFNLHLINTDKFKTVTTKIIFHTPIKKEDITKRNILSDILLQSSKNYPSKRDLIIKSEDLYAADIYNNNERAGNYILTSFILQVLNDKYTEEDNLEEALDFLSEILFNPDINNNSFNEEKLSLVKNNCKVSLSSIKEDPVNYAQIRLNEAYDKNSPVSYRMTGYEEDLDKINTKNLYKYYENMINNDYVDIFVVGQIDENKITDIIKKKFKFRKIKKQKSEYEIDIKKVRSRRLFAKETIEASQSKLVIACPVGKMTKDEKNYALTLANIIFGGSVDSKLFKIVREKHSLCYVIFSSLSKLDNLITIKAGIDKENYLKTVDVITEILDQMKKGKFSEKDVNMAKEIYISSINNIEEKPLYLINEYFSEEITKLDNYQERVAKIKKVTKKDIIKALKKIKMDTIFLLEGDTK